MKFHVYNLFRIRKKIMEYKLEKKQSQEWRIIHAKQKSFEGIEQSYSFIQSSINPFLYEFKEAIYLEDIDITYESFFEGTRPLHYIARNPYVKVKERRKMMHEIIKKWEYDYYKTIDQQLKRTLDQASYIPVKNIKRIKNGSIYSYMWLAFLFLFLLRQYSFLQLIPRVGSLFTKINTLLIYERFYSIAVIIVYLSIVISMYLIIVKVYFDKVLQYGLSAKGFLIKERDRMLRKFRPNIKKIQSHLHRMVKYKTGSVKFKVDNHDQSTLVIKRIKRYGRTVIQRVGIFTTYYKPILLISTLLKILNMGLILYLVIELFLINRIFIF